MTGTGWMTSLEPFQGLVASYCQIYDSVKLVYVKTLTCAIKKRCADGRDMVVAYLPGRNSPGLHLGTIVLIDVFSRSRELVTGLLPLDGLILTICLVAAKGQESSLGTSNVKIMTLTGADR